MELIEDRRNKLQALRDLGIDPYSLDDEMSSLTGYLLTTKSAVNKLLRDGGDLSQGFQNGPEAVISGRVMLLRKMGKLAFITIRDSSGDLQLGVSLKNIKEKDWAVVQNLDLSDIVFATGKMGSTKTGEPTLWVEKINIVSKSVATPPSKVEGLVDIEKRYRQRYVDMWSNPDTMKTLLARSNIIQKIRNYLYDWQYLEVETPMMHSIPGGAIAAPFLTHHKALDIPLYMRIAPELYLKKMLVGGMSKVFELNRNFRNEGISPRHNPEFTALEVYKAYSDYEGMIELVKELFSQLSPQNNWETIKLTDLVERETGWKWDGNANPDLEFVDQGPFNQLVSVYEKYCEPKLINPTFVTHFPSGHVPLAKPNAESFAEMFEFVMNGQEIGCGYTENNDPDIQLKVLLEQAGGDESKVDFDFIEALRVGMPPAGGLGIGIDRLVMALTGSTSIRDVIAFPLMRPNS